MKLWDPSQIANENKEGGKGEKERIVYLHKEPAVAEQGIKEYQKKEHSVRKQVCHTKETDPEEKKIGNQIFLCFPAIASGRKRKLRTKRRELFPVHKAEQQDPKYQKNKGKQAVRKQEPHKGADSHGVSAGVCFSI